MRFVRKAWFTTKNSTVGLVKKARAIEDTPGVRKGIGGFTLLEMLAVIVLIGLIGTVVVTEVGKNMQKGKYGAGKAQLITLGQEIEDYALDNGAPPPNLKALVTPPSEATHWMGPYAKPSQLRDPFGHAFGYRYPGQHGPFDLIFYGEDGKPGGTGLNQDVGNWQ